MGLFQQTRSTEATDRLQNPEEYRNTEREREEYYPYVKTLNFESNETSVGSIDHFRCKRG